MATRYPNGNFHSEKDQLKAEIQVLKLELQVLKTEMSKFKEFMNTKASFVDFKVFKFNEDKEKFRHTYWNELPNQRGDLDSLWGNTEEIPF